MSMTDPIADMLTRIRNANLAYLDYVDIPASKIKQRIAELFKDEGFVADVEVVKKPIQDTIRIHLKYGQQNKRVITTIQRVSKPGRRVYASVDHIPKVLNGLGIAILTTSKGLVTDKQARKLGIGGEVLCFIA